MLRALGATSVVLAVSIVGCGKRTVPFKREQAARIDAGAEAGAPLPATAQARTYPAQTRSLEYQGQVLALEQAVILASLEVPALHRAGAYDLLLAVEDSDGALALERWQPDGREQWAHERMVTLVDAAERGRCVLDAARLAALSPSVISAVADLQCAPVPAATGAHGSDTPAAVLGRGAVVEASPPAPAPVSPNAAAAELVAPAMPNLEGRPERRLWAVALPAPARVIEHLTAFRDGEAPLNPTLESRDLDNDGHADLLVRLELTAGQAKPSAVELEFFDRAGGLVRAVSEPERSLLALADAAAAAERSRDPRALELARRVLALHATLCREAGAPGLLIGDRGLDCGPSLAAGRAASVVTAALASAGKLADALASFRALRQPMYRLSDSDWTRARTAVRSRTDAGGYSWRTGAALVALRAPELRRGRVAFIDEGHVLVRGPAPRSYDLSSGKLEPVGIAGGIVLTDPSGRLAVSAMQRSCAGYHLSIVRASQIVAGVVAGPPVAQPLVIPAAPPLGASCPDLTPDQRRDHGGLRVVDWTASGVLIARDQVLYLIALDATGNALSQARQLSPRDRLPAITYSGEITPDGRYHVWLTPVGPAIHDRHKDTTRFLTYPSAAGAMTDIAISPSGTNLALVQGNQLSIGSLGSQPPSPSP
jgi:hypothetical protein